MSDIIYYHIQHENGRPVSINLERINDDDVAIPVTEIEPFYTGEEVLDNWLVVNGEFVKNNLGFDTSRRELIELIPLKKPTGNPALIISPNYQAKYVEFTYPQEYNNDVDKTSILFLVNDDSHEIATSDFFNGYFRLYVNINKSDRLRIQNLFRNTELVPGYINESLRNPLTNLLFLDVDEDGYYRLPQFLYGSMATYTTFEDRQTILSSELVTTQARYLENLRLVVGKYEIRKN